MLAPPASGLTHVFTSHSQALPRARPSAGAARPGLVHSQDVVGPASVSAELITIAAEGRQLELRCRQCTWTSVMTREQIVALPVPVLRSTLGEVHGRLACRACKAKGPGIEAVFVPGRRVAPSEPADRWRIACEFEIYAYLVKQGIDPKSLGLPIKGTAGGPRLRVIWPH